MKQILRRSLPLLVLVVLPHAVKARSWLAKHDPYPLYQSVYDPYMTKWKKECMKGVRPVCIHEPHVSFAVSPFIQTASNGKPFGGSTTLSGTNITATTNQLGDLTGPWNMLGMLYGPRPTGVSLAGTQLGTAKQYIFNNITPAPPSPDLVLPGCVIGEVCDDKYVLTDPNKLIGFFSVPLKYKNMGVRFELSAQPFDGIGFTIQGGVVEYRQTTTGFTNLTPSTSTQVSFTQAIPLYPSTTPCSNNNSANCTSPLAQINAQLMDPANAATIFKELGYDTCNFEKTSAEDINLYLWARKVLAFNRGMETWPPVLIIPSIAVNASFPVGKKRDYQELLGLGFGNNGHFAIGADVGIAFDFFETMELAFLVGATHFTSKTVANYPLPTDSYQSGIYPFRAPVSVQPGNNFNFNAILHAYHFIDHLSVHAEYVMVKHEPDKLKLKIPNTVDPTAQCSATNTTPPTCPPNSNPCCDLQKEIFLPEQAACLTKFTSSFINAGLNYDITPHITLGFIAQFPIKQRNSYASTTWMGSIRVLY